MERYVFMAVMGLLLLGLCACGRFTPPETTTGPTFAVTVPTAKPTTAPTAKPTTVPTAKPTTVPTAKPTTVPTTAPSIAATTAATTAPTGPVHSPLYIQGVSQEQMITYFNEVVLSMEYSSGDGNPSVVQKWTGPLYYYIVGQPTDRDQAVLEKLTAQLNAIPGFPGIRPATGLARNVGLHFLDRAAFRAQFSAVVGGEDAEGAVQFWYYTASNVIHEGRIGYRTDISQQTRDSVIPEEIVNLLGVNDTVLRKDSIVYQYASTATELSEVDLVILQLLYNPKIQCGMDAKACEAVIKTLYY